MKLQEQLSRKVGNKKYNKYVITIPPKEIERLGWETGSDLEIWSKGDKLVIGRQKRRKVQ